MKQTLRIAHDHYNSLYVCKQQISGLEEQRNEVE